MSAYLHSKRLLQSCFNKQIVVSKKDSNDKPQDTYSVVNHKITDRIKVCMLGNPNCGKSTIFNLITNSRENVGNWPGVTIEKKVGYATLDNTDIEFIDLPGVYALNFQNDNESSEDEKLVSNFLLNAQYDLIINVLDATNLKRGLYLTLQLLEMQHAMVIAINMMDMAQIKGIEIDINYLQHSLKIPVVTMSARKKKGIDNFTAAITNFNKKTLSAQQLLYSIDRHQEEKDISGKVYNYYPPLIRDGLVAVQEELQKSSNMKCNKFWLALRAIEDGSLILGNDVDTNVELLISKYQDIIRITYQEDHELVFTDIRYNYIETLIHNTTRYSDSATKSYSDSIDVVLLNKILGLPIFFILIYLMFTFSIIIGGAFQDFFDLCAGAIFVDYSAYLLEQISTPKWLVNIISDGIGGGIKTVAPFIPVIGGLYLFLSFLEESGYINRVAFLADRLMRKVGLPGQAFVPLIIGFGCNVPAIMATRTLENKKVRIATIMIAPFVSCSARLSVFVLFCAAFFPHNGQNIIFMLYLIGIIVGLVTGYVVTKILGYNQQPYFIIELPEYRLPQLKTIFLKTYDRLKGFVSGAGKLIIIVFLIIKLLNMLSTDYSNGHENKNSSIITIIAHIITPIFKPMGIDESNWPATVGIFTGLFAKEVIVGTLNALYLPEQQQPLKQHGKSLLLSDLMTAVMTIPHNLANGVNSLLNPMWLNISNSHIQEAFLQENQLNNNIINILQLRFDGAIGAIAYLLFILLYFPCISVFAVIYQEIGKKWAILNSVWSTVIAYSVSVLFYQIARCIIGEPYSMLNITIACALLFAAYKLLELFSLDNNSVKNFFSDIFTYKNYRRKNK